MCCFCTTLQYPMVKVGGRHGMEPLGGRAQRAGWHLTFWNKTHSIFLKSSWEFFSLSPSLPFHHFPLKTKNAQVINVTQIENNFVPLCNPFPLPTQSLFFPSYFDWPFRKPGSMHSPPNKTFLIQSNLGGGHETANNIQMQTQP